ncbi:1-acyl-sn-glycerol-3-phosphate acyltransferase [Pigmentiphaga aceris]|uniref:1-acyl-sn-glycerol-3-phosphate acyltransferase n=1 Tax=Pigmentiphaga aceris TaxID=1940612 RepID=A0A5C0AZL7_9BURK|nr:lysophospholipid acyltransferase family protein [Pigmentiphaga aceris]QEI07625.1 1-acyl-sn-glycerol-3-phosphate acyltransferase [Pigmentiphaga aceris]
MAIAVLGWFPWAARWLATASSFALFGLGGLVLTLLVFPLLRLMTRNPLTRRRWTRLIINRLFHRFIRYMRVSGALTYSIDGAERLGRPGQMVIANHPSLLDVVFVIAQIRDSNCIVKSALWDNPFTRGPVSSAGYISNDSSLDMLEEAIDVLKDGQTLIVFPEGTRTTPGVAPSFHRGAAAIALRGAQVITPLIISVEPGGLQKNQPWYRIPARRMHFHLRVGTDIDPAVYRDAAPGPRAARMLNDFLQQYFSKEMGLHDATRT